MKSIKILPYYFEHINDKYLISNLSRDYIFLSQEDFERLYNENISGDLEQKLYENHFIIYNEKELDNIIEKYRYMHAGLFKGTFLHIFVLTLDCNLNCLYCQAAYAKNNCFMDIDTAKKAVDIALQSPEKTLTFEFQGGEPLMNFPTMKFIIEYAQKYKNNKEIIFSLVTNAGLMTDDILDYLLLNDVNICISMDGPQNIHDTNRPTKSGKSNFEQAYYWYTRAKQKYGNCNKLSKVTALPTITRHSLKSPKEIINHYVKLETTHISIREISPFGRAAKNWNKISYTPEEFINFYTDCMDYIIELTLQGNTKIKESFTEMILSKILGKNPVNYTDLRSPCGAAIGQIAYNWNGNVYTCDEGRMMANNGIELFCLGNVNKNNYADLINSDTACLVCNSSCVETNPNCNVCVFNNICGLCPVYSYYTQNDFIGTPIKQDRCKILKGIYRYIISWLNSPDQEKRKLCYEWIK